MKVSMLISTNEIDFPNTPICLFLFFGVCVPVCVCVCVCVCMSVYV